VKACVIWIWIMNNNNKRKKYECGMRQEQNKNYESLCKFQGYLWDCWMSMLYVFLVKKSHKIHSIKESIKICILLNINRHFISQSKSHFNTTGFRCIEQKILIVLIEYRKIYLYSIKILIEYHKTFLFLKSLLKSHEIPIQYTYMRFQSWKESKSAAWICQPNIIAIRDSRE
jgi:hypothetical protein